MKISELRLVLIKQSYRMTLYANRAKRAGQVDDYKRWYTTVAISKEYIDFLGEIRGKREFILKNSDYVKEKIYMILEHTDRCSKLIVQQKK